MQVFVMKHNMNGLIFLLSCILTFGRRSSKEVQYSRSWMSCCFDNAVYKYLQTLLKEIKRMDWQFNLCNLMYSLFVEWIDFHSTAIDFGWNNHNSLHWPSIKSCQPHYPIKNQQSLIPTTCMHSYAHYHIFTPVLLFVVFTF